MIVVKLYVRITSRDDKLLKIKRKKNIMEISKFGRTIA